MFSSSKTGPLALSLALGLAARGALAANNLNFVFSRGGFETISGPAGNEIGHSEGFTLTLQDGTELYNTNSPNGGATCATDSGIKFGMTSSCWDGTLTFQCSSKFDGNPGSCKSWTADDIEYDGAADDDTNFIGISISVDGWCGGPIYAGPGNCTPDDDFTVIKV
ncbi:hypothetical protein SLS62_008565 [Diatrype stigma]|uniref:Uncharacterized protein n=1 Tax=Diatrype stigma TaxID=117547 RepID=A0AAN9URB4_9PEZI